LDEVFEIADRIVVFRNGRAVADARPAETTTAQLIEHMLGVSIVQSERQLQAEVIQLPTASPPVMRVLGYTRAGLPNIKNLNFDLRRGEVVGMFGPRGSGVDVVADGLGGRLGDFRGRIICNDKELAPFKNPGDAKRAGVGYVPAERKRDGLILGMSVESN